MEFLNLDISCSLVAAFYKDMAFSENCILKESHNSDSTIVSMSTLRNFRSRSAPVAVTLVGQYKAISSGTSDTGDEDEDEGIGSAESLVSSPELEQQHL